jgi:hypothetical protein
LRPPRRRLEDETQATPDRKSGHFFPDSQEIDPLAYLKDIRERLPTYPTDRLGERLPDAWVVANPPGSKQGGVVTGEPGRLVWVYAGRDRSRTITLDERQIEILKKREKNLS